MFKRVIGLGLGIFTFFTFTPLSWAHQYQDVPEESPYYYAIHYLRRNDVFKDTLLFRPDTLLSKAEFVRYLVMLNSPDFNPSEDARLPFEDTRDNAWYAPYFKEAIKLGILDDRKKKAEPNKKLTMVDALTLLFHSQSIPIPNVYKGNIPYTDVARNTQAAPLIMRALSLDIIYPKRGDYVGIYQRVNRAQAAQMIYKMDLVTLGSAHSNGLPQVSTHTPELDKIISVWKLIENRYLEQKKLNKGDLADTMLKELVNELDDPYSAYMDEQQNRNFLDSLDGEIEGIGAVVGFDENDQITVVSPIKGGPADRAGLMAKDIIVEVDEIILEGMSLEDAVLLIKGPKGSMVKLKVRRKEEILTLIIERDLIQIPSVEYEKIENGRIMYMNLSQFNFNAADEFQLAVNAMKADASIKGLIIDVRSNPGGLLDVALKILGHFVPAQEELVSIHYSDYSQVLLSRGNAGLSDFPVVVLINEGSASASEILAGTLQDYEIARIVGEQSFGKGTVQEVSYFIDNSSIKLTVAKWLTPGLQDIQDGGITPDLLVVDDETTEKDEQLEAAIIEINKQIR